MNQMGPQVVPAAPQPVPAAQPGAGMPPQGAPMPQQQGPMTALQAAAMSQQMGGALQAGQGQPPPPGEWEDILRRKALSEGTIDNMDMAQDSLARAAAQNTNPLGLLAVALGAYGIHKRRKNSKSELAKAMADEKGMSAYEEKQERIREMREQLAEEAREQARQDSTYKRDRADTVEDRDTGREHEMDLQALRNKRGPGTVVNTGDMPWERVGTDGLLFNRETGEFRAGDGSPMERDQNEQDQKEEARIRTQLKTTDNVIEEIDHLMENVGPMTSGIGGAASRIIPGSPSVDFEAGMKTVLGNIGFDRLQRMREESPTGGALGQVSNLELGLLTSTVSGYDPNMSEEGKVRMLEKVRRHYGNFIQALDGQMPEDYSGMGDAETESDLLGMANMAIEQGADAQEVMARLAELRGGE